VRIGESVNEYGTPVSVHVCDTCGQGFTCCPAIPEGQPGWENCLSESCPSYDLSRDIDLAWDYSLVRVAL
jgi:hypothetical protein